MIYSYKCLQCENQVTINKPMSESDQVEHCEICESELKRVYGAPAISTADGVKR